MGPYLRQEEGSDYYWPSPLYWEMTLLALSREDKVTLRPMVSRPVSLGIKPRRGEDQNFVTVSCGFVDMGRFL
jgi:hypothetical protein